MGPFPNDAPPANITAKIPRAPMVSNSLTSSKDDAMDRPSEMRTKSGCPYAISPTKSSIFPSWMSVVRAEPK
jgi:hypothetical protein